MTVEDVVLSANPHANDYAERNGIKDTE